MNFLTWSFCVHLIVVTLILLRSFRITHDLCASIFSNAHNCKFSNLEEWICLLIDLQMCTCMDMYINICLYFLIDICMCASERFLLLMNKRTYHMGQLSFPDKITNHHYCHRQAWVLTADMHTILCVSRMWIIELPLILLVGSGWEWPNLNNGCKPVAAVSRMRWVLVW